MIAYRNPWVVSNVRFECGMSSLQMHESTGCTDRNEMELEIKNLENISNASVEFKPRTKW